MMRKVLPMLCLCLACGDDAKPKPAAGNGGCEAVIANWKDTCGSDDAYPLEDCEQQEGVWLSAGCNKEWATYTSCEASAKLDCEEGEPAGCDAKLDALFVCQSQFVRRTGCAGLGYDEECAAATPYAVSCLDGEPPSKACVAFEDDARSFCCP